MTFFISTHNTSPKQVALVTGIPTSKLTQSDRERLLGLRNRLEQRVIGQDDAVVALSNAVLRNRAGFSSEGRPAGSFLFLGSTGVGKTELAKALAEQLFDDERAIIRVDCSEYMEKHAVSRLIGAPPGYVGFDKGGQLTDAVSRNPYSVVLIDEADKAHRDVFNLFLQILDDGRLTDSKGVVVDFKHCYIIFTSNLGYRHLDEVSEFMTRDIKSRVLKAARDHFRPEFLNRLDDIIVFSPLSKSSLIQIASLLLDNLRQKVGPATLNVTNEALELIVDRSYDPQYGARPIRRFVEQELGTQIAMEVLRRGDVDVRRDIYVDVGGNHLVLNVVDDESHVLGSNDHDDF